MNRTVKQAAEQWNISERTVRDWIYLRKVTYIRVGRCIRIPQSEIDKVLEQGTIPARRRLTRIPANDDQ
jgi:excisionase family DNA binding protein